MILSELVSLDTPFEPSPAMEQAIREGLRSVREERTYSAVELRSRIAAWTARQFTAKRPYPIFLRSRRSSLSTMLTRPGRRSRKVEISDVRCQLSESGGQS